MTLVYHIAHRKKQTYIVGPNPLVRGEGGVSSRGVEEIIELRDNGVEEDKGGPRSEDTLAKSLTIRRIVHEHCPVLCVVCILYGSS